VAVEESEAKEITEHMEKQKAFLKNRLISYLSDQSMHEVTRQIGVNRIRREIRDEFNAILYPEGEEKILDVLFDEFVVQ
jgi:flagellar protein FliL